MSSSVLVRSAARALLAPVLVVALAMLVKGHDGVGDGFSAGAIAALALLLQYVALGREQVERALPTRRLAALAFCGLLAALAFALEPLARGEPLLAHAPGPGGEATEIGSLKLIGALGFDVAVCALVVGAVGGIVRAVARADEETER